MIGMQYKIILPRDYDMEIIKRRVKDNGHKTDDFPGLNFKAYLITEAEKDGNLYNSYAPLYIWDTSEGMNRFIFKGFYDNILMSFGWQRINIGVPLSINLDKDFYKSKYVMEYAGTVPECKSLANAPLPSTPLKNLSRNLGDLVIYNPDKWGFSQFQFFQEKPVIDPSNQMTVYQILHVSH